LRAAGVALSLSLSLLAGCAAPMVTSAPDATGTATVTPAGTAEAPAAPAAQPAAPAMPAPAASTATTLSGTASFRGELLSGYAVQVLNAQTGEPVALKSDLSGVTGLAVLDRNLVTDAKGQFSLQVVGLSAGQALLVVATKNNVRVEAVVTSNMQSLGAKGYTIAQAGTSFTLTELTTAIAKVARGVLSTTQVLTPASAAPVLAKLATKMAALSAKLDAALALNPNFANGLISQDAKDGDTLKTLVSNAGELKGLTQSVAELVADVVEAAKSGKSAAAADAALQTKLARIDFVGTVLAGAFDGAKGSFTLTNTVNGNSIEAGAGTLSSVTTQVVRSGGSNRSAQPAGTPVSDTTTLFAALADPDVSAIYFTGDITLTASNRSFATYKVTQFSEFVPVCPPFCFGEGDLPPFLSPTTYMTVSRAVTIDGRGFALNSTGVHNVYAEGVTLKNITFNQRVHIEQPTTVTNCTFNVPSYGLQMAYYNATAEQVALISGNTFNKNPASSYDYGVEIYFLPDPFKQQLISNNRFVGYAEMDSLVSYWD
jgi:hypothetical protein